MNNLPVLDLPRHRTYLDAMTSSTPRERALVRLMDCPLFVAFTVFPSKSIIEIPRGEMRDYFDINPEAATWVINRANWAMWNIQAGRNR